MEPSQAPAAAPTTCRLCGAAAGPSEECPGCKVELDAYLAGLVAERTDLEAQIIETPGDLEAIARLPVEPPAPDAREPQAATHPPRRRGRRTLIAAVALGSLAMAGSLALSQGDSGEGPRADKPQRSAASSTPAQGSDTEGFGNWNGQGQVVYENGTTDELSVALRVGPLEPGKRVGTAATTQSDNECRGSLTSLGRRDGVFRFAYRERNTAECVASSEITLTPRANHRIAYRETTETSVNRALLTRE